MEILTIVAPNKTISILRLQLTIHIFFSLFHCNIHVPIKTGQYAFVIGSRIQFYIDRSSEDCFEKIRR